MNETDREHLRLLSIFHYVVAGVLALFACVPIIHLGVGFFLIFAPPQGEAAPRALGVFFVVLASILILSGWTLAACLAFAGRCLAAHRRYTFCMVVAAIACVFMPLGTVLGVFTILVLMRPGVKEAFASARDRDGYER